jgi:hypothetical protein
MDRKMSAEEEYVLDLLPREKAFPLRKCLLIARGGLVVEVTEQSVKDKAFSLHVGLGIPAYPSFTILILKRACASWSC